MRPLGWQTLRAIELLRHPMALAVSMCDVVLFGRPGDAALDARHLLVALYRLRSRLQLAIDALEREVQP
jgi:hypothetical protein